MVVTCCVMEGAWGAWRGRRRLGECGLRYQDDSHGAVRGSRDRTTRRRRRSRKEEEMEKMEKQKGEKDMRKMN